MDNRDAAKFFNKFAVPFDTFYEGKRNNIMQWIDKTFRKDMFLRYALTFEKMGDLAGCTVIDIGCGSGIYLTECLKKGAQKVTGLDPAEGMINLTRNRLSAPEFAERYKLVEGIFPGVNLEKYDHAIVMGVLDYIEDAAAFLAELQKIVNKSACISFPSEHWFRTPLRKFRYKLRKCPVYFYNRKKVQDLAEKAGFSRVEINKIPGAGMDFHVWVQP